MTGSKSQLLQNGSSIVSVKGESSGKNTLRFSGRMDKIITCDELSDQFVTQVSVAARENEAIVVLQYTDITKDTWRVTPQSPLLITSRQGKDLSIITIYPAKDGSFLPPSDYNEAIVEVLIETGTTEVNIDDGPFLILNASQGVELDRFNGSVDSWKDVRPTSGAPEKWLNPGGANATLTPASPNFNASATIQGGPPLFYQGSSDSFSFMDSGESFTVMSILYPEPGTALMQLLDCLTLSHEGGYRPTVKFESNNPWQGTTNTVETFKGGLSSNGLGSLFQTEELTRKPTAIVFDYNVSGSEGTLRVYYQGRWQELSATREVDSIVNTGVLLFLSSEIADFRIYDRSATSEEIGDYITNIAVKQYGVDDTEGPNSPIVTGPFLYTRFNRLVFLSEGDPTYEGTVASKSNERIEFTVSQWLAKPSILGGFDTVLAPTVDGLGVRTNGSGIFSSALACTETDFSKFDFLNGSGDLTISIVFKLNSPKQDYAGLFVMGAYDANDWGAGSNIFLKDGYVYLQTDNGDTSVRVNYDSETEDFLPQIKTGRTYALIYRIQDSATDSPNGIFYADLIDVETGVVFSKIGACTSAANGTAQGTPTLAGIDGQSSPVLSLDVTYYELGIANDLDIDLESYKEYVLARYS